MLEEMQPNGSSEWSTSLGQSRLTTGQSMGTLGVEYQ